MKVDTSKAIPGDVFVFRGGARNTVQTVSLATAPCKQHSFLFTDGTARSFSDDGQYWFGNQKSDRDVIAIHSEDGICKSPAPNKPDLTQVTNDELVAELARRLESFPF